MSRDGPLTIQALHETYESAQESPSSMVTSLFERIHSHQFSTNPIWIDTVPLSKLLERTKELEERYKRVPKPSLYGIPFSVKNNIDVEGFKTTAGCESFAYVAKETAEVVKRCLEAGAILIGTTNLEQFATGLTGCRSPYGTPRCPHDGTLCAGGSSSGSAASVAAQLCAFSLGTDTAGSIRVPAALNGLVGLDPTFGSISKRNIVPAMPTLDRVGILATTVDDTRRVFNVINGYDDLDPFSRLDETFSPSLNERWEELESLKFGLPGDALFLDVSPEYNWLFGSFVKKITSHGFIRSTTFDYSSCWAANDMLYGSSLVAQRVASFSQYLRAHGTESLHPVVRKIFESSDDYTAVQAFKDLQRVAELKRVIERQFRQNIDVLIVPSTTKHFTIGQVEKEPFETNRSLGTFSQFVNLVDLCAISVPAGTWANVNGNKIPFGVTLIAEAGRDEDLLRLAGEIEKWYRN